MLDDEHLQILSRQEAECRKLPLANETSDRQAFQ